MRLAVATTDGITYRDASPDEAAALQSEWASNDAKARLVTTEHVKAEARRRILDRFPDWRQVNMTARGVELQDIWRRNGKWTVEEQAESDALSAAWGWIKSVRMASDAVEAMTPIPIDFSSDRYWPT